MGLDVQIYRLGSSERFKIQSILQKKKNYISMKHQKQSIISLQFLRIT